MTDRSGGASRRFDIGELAELAGLQTSALRHYEREGLLRPVDRVGGRRVYDEQGLRQLAAIDFWQEAGFTLREINWLLNAAGGNIDEAKKVAAERIDELDRLIRQAIHIKEFLTHVLGCVHGKLSDCPYYEDHLTERADRIMTGEHDRPQRRQTLGGRPQMTPGTRRADTGG